MSLQVKFSNITVPPKISEIIKFARTQSFKKACMYCLWKGVLPGRHFLNAGRVLSCMEVQQANSTKEQTVIYGERERIKIWWPALEWIPHFFMCYIWWGGLLCAYLSLILHPKQQNWSNVQPGFKEQCL